MEADASPGAAWRDTAEWATFFALAPVLRSGVTSKIFEMTGLDHLIELKETVKIDLRALTTWKDVAKESKFKCGCQWYLDSAVKLVGLHLLQPLFFFLPYLAYMDTMGPMQFLFATVVVLNELLLYLAVIALVRRKTVFSFSVHFCFNPQAIENEKKTVNNK